MTLKELFKNIADTIRDSHYDGDSTIKATDFPAKIQEACDHREAIGYDIGKPAGIEEGRQAENEAFWKQFQRWNGSLCARTAYNQAFMNWSANEIKPIFPVKNASPDMRYAFYYGNIRSTSDLNFASWTWNTTQTASASTQYMFYRCLNLQELDWYNQFKFSPRNISSMFELCSNLKTISNLSVSNVAVATNAFKGCTALEDITFYYGEKFNLDADGLILDFSECINLSNQSFHQINAACCGEYNTYWGTATKTIKFPSNAEEKFIAKNPDYGAVNDPWGYYLYELQDYGGWTVIY